MLELAENLVLNKSDSEIVFMPLPQDDPEQENQIFHWLGKNLIGSLK